jgi:hypothetical protein
LIEEAKDLRERLRAIGSERNDKVESLATTPVAFNYSAEEASLGFDKRSPLQKAFKASGHSFVAMMSMLLILLGTVAPWAALAGGLYWLVRRLRMKSAAQAASE